MWRSNITISYHSFSRIWQELHSIHIGDLENHQSGYSSYSIRTTLNKQASVTRKYQSSRKEKRIRTLILGSPIWHYGIPDVTHSRHYRKDLYIVPRDKRIMTHTKFHLDVLHMHPVSKFNKRQSVRSNLHQGKWNLIRNAPNNVFAPRTHQKRRRLPLINYLFYTTNIWNVYLRTGRKKTSDAVFRPCFFHYFSQARGPLSRAWRFCRIYKRHK